MIHFPQNELLPRHALRFVHSFQNKIFQFTVSILVTNIEFVFIYQLVHHIIISQIKTIIRKKQKLNYSQLSPCGHPAITNTQYYGQNPEPGKSWRGLTRIDSRYYGLSLLQNNGHFRGQTTSRVCPLQWELTVYGFSLTLAIEYTLVFDGTHSSSSSLPSESSWCMLGSYNRINKQNKFCM